MINPANDFFRKNQPKGKPVVLSLDLDNTLVVRDKGANYINPRVKSLLIKLIKDYKVAVVPNTGRESVSNIIICKFRLLEASSIYPN